MDHFYDKLLHLADFGMDAQNPYIRQEADRRMEPLVEVCLEFGRTGVVPEARIAGKTTPDGNRPQH